MYTKQGQEKSKIQMGIKSTRNQKIHHLNKRQRQKKTNNQKKQPKLHQQKNKSTLTKKKEHPHRRNMGYHDFRDEDFILSSKYSIEEVSFEKITSSRSSI
jgi:hypothetical protein